MKICPNCNNENVDYANNCTNCGFSFVQQQNQMNENETQKIPENYNQQTVSNDVNSTEQNITQHNANYNQYNNPNQGHNNQQSKPLNQKSKIIGLLLNIILVGLGYAYVGKWGEGIVLLVLYLLMWILGFLLFFPWIIAIALWVYSLFKTNTMIDNYNNGLPY